MIRLPGNTIVAFLSLRQYSLLDSPIVVFDGTDIKGNDYVYDILDWNNNPGWSAAFVGGTVVALPIMISVFYFLAKFRDFLWAKYYASIDNIQGAAPYLTPLRFGIWDFCFTSASSNTYTVTSENRSRKFFRTRKIYIFLKSL